MLFISHQDYVPLLQQPDQTKTLILVPIYYCPVSIEFPGCIARTEVQEETGEFPEFRRRSPQFKETRGREPQFMGHGPKQKRTPQRENSRYQLVRLLSRIRLFATLWTVAHEAPPSMEFSRQECWSGLPFPSPGVFLLQGVSRDQILVSRIVGRHLLSEPQGKLRWYQLGSSDIQQHSDSHVHLMNYPRMEKDLQR